MLRTLLLDRDGTLNRDTGYLVRPDEIEILPGVVEGLTRFRDAGFQFFVLTNQSAIERGMCTREDVDACNARVSDALAENDIFIEEYFVCPHRRESDCDCRKPKTGLWDQLLHKHPELSVEQSLFVGDKDTDILCGKAIGCFTARISSDQYEIAVEPDYTVTNLLELATLLLDS